MSNLKIVDTKEHKLCISYNTLVAFEHKPSKKLFVTTEKYSATTSKHISKFLKSSSYPTITPISEYELLFIYQGLLPQLIGK